MSNERRVTLLEQEMEKLKASLEEEKQRGDRLEAKLAAMLLLETHGGTSKSGLAGLSELVDVGMDALAQHAHGFDQSRGSIGHALVSAVATMIATSTNKTVETLSGINVIGEDPDRFAFSLQDSFNRHTHPTSSGPTKLKDK